MEHRLSRNPGFVGKCGVAGVKVTVERRETTSRNIDANRIAWGNGSCSMAQIDDVQVRLGGDCVRSQNSHGQPGSNSVRVYLTKPNDPIHARCVGNSPKFHGNRSSKPKRLLERRAGGL